MNCELCNKETSNPKYCSKRCSAISTNKKYPKRTKTLKCRKCDNLRDGNSFYCKDHRVKLFKQTLSEVIYKFHHKSSAFALVRNRARSVCKRKFCENCGYDKHVEICHIKAISKFPSDTLVSEINSSSNLLALCPNCHWEFDNGILKISSPGQT